MRKTIGITLSILFLVCCKKGSESNQNILVKPELELYKIIVIHNEDISLTFFKLKVSNKNNKSIIFLDNSLKENLEPEKSGFYLKNNKNDLIIRLGIDSYHVYQFGGKKTGFLYVAGANIRNSFNVKDSLKLRETLSNYTLEYNGKKLDLDIIKKNNYINQKGFDEFQKKKKDLIPVNDSLSIKIPNHILLNYIKDIPTNQNEWDNL